MKTEYRRSTARLIAGLSGLACVAWGSPLAAQPTEQPAAAEQHTERATVAAPDENSTDLKLQAGAQLQSGNTQSYAVNGGLAFALVRRPHRFGLDFVGAWGASAPADGGNVGTTARNLNARLRYDYFLTENDALFVGMRHRWDTFAGLDSRLQNQVGYLRQFYHDDDYRFWGEVGYDLTWDEYFFTDPMTMVRVDDTAIVHAARAFLGLESQFNEHVKLVAGVESLFNLEEGQDVRVNSLVTLTAAFTEKFKLEITFICLFDNVPVPTNEKTDTTTLISLVYDAI